MASNKSRNKPYKARIVMIPAIIPMVSASVKYPDLALKLHGGIT